MSQAHLIGTRLAYVVVPLDGVVQRKINTWTKKAGLAEKYIDQPAGYLVYFPRGHVLRMRDKEQLRHYKLDKPARLINLQGLTDPKSALGKLMMSQDDAERRGAMQSLEEQVIRMAQAQSGKITLTTDPRDLPNHEEREDA